MKRLIVSADDFGLTKGVTDGIIVAHRQGIVTSASIMATGRAFDYAVEQSEANPGLDIGIHLTLVEERSVLERKQIPSLVDGEQRFPRHYREFFKQLLLGRIELADVARELRAQVDKCLAAGLAPSHLNSHQHMHVFPPIFRIVARIAADYGIASIRLPRERARLRHAGSLSRFVESLALFSMAVVDQMWLSKEELSYCDSTLGMLPSGHLQEETLAEILSRLGEGVTEIICHPGLEDPLLLRDYSWWNYHWEAELSALTSGRIKSLIQDLNIELTNWRAPIPPPSASQVAGEAR